MSEDVEVAAVTATEKTVLLVALEEAQFSSAPLPQGADGITAATCDEAMDALSLSLPDLIIANDTIGKVDALEFFAQIIAAHPEDSTPLMILTSPASGLDPFFCQRRRVGFEVRYLDGNGGLHTHFINEPAAESSVAVVPIPRERLGDEIARILSDEGGDAAPTHEDEENRILELGFNQDLVVEGSKYHIQTEVVSAAPLAVSVMVFSAGRTVHADQKKLKHKKPSLAIARAQVESIHADAVSRVSSGELR